MYVFKLLVNHFSVTNKTKSSFSKPKEMISHCCLDAKTSLRRFFRSTCDFFSQKSSSLKEKCAFLNKSKTTQNRSESLRKWFLTAASTQRHPWEEFFGQHVIFLTEIRLLKEKMCIFKQEKDKTNSFWKPKEMISHRCLNTKTSLWRFIRSTSLIYFNRNNGPLKGKW